jgi:hypothetical protein
MATWRFRAISTWVVVASVEFLGCYSVSAAGA